MVLPIIVRNDQKTIVMLSMKSKHDVKLTEYNYRQNECEQTELDF